MANKHQLETTFIGSVNKTLDLQKFLGQEYGAKTLALYNALLKAWNFASIQAVCYEDFQVAIKHIEDLAYNLQYQCKIICDYKDVDWIEKSNLVDVKFKPVVKDIEITFELENASKNLYKLFTRDIFTFLETEGYDKTQIKHLVLVDNTQNYLRATDRSKDFALSKEDDNFLIVKDKLYPLLSQLANDNPDLVPIEHIVLEIVDNKVRFFHALTSNNDGTALFLPYYDQKYDTLSCYIKPENAHWSGGNFRFEEVDFKDCTIPCKLTFTDNETEKFDFIIKHNYDVDLIDYTGIEEDTFEIIIDPLFNSFLGYGRGKTNNNTNDVKLFNNVYFENSVHQKIMQLFGTLGVRTNTVFVEGTKELWDQFITDKNLVDPATAFEEFPTMYDLQKLDVPATITFDYKKAIKKTPLLIQNEMQYLQTKAKKVIIRKVCHENISINKLLDIKLYQILTCYTCENDSICADKTVKIQVQLFVTHPKDKVDYTLDITKENIIRNLTLRLFNDLRVKEGEVIVEGTSENVSIRDKQTYYDGFIFTIEIADYRKFLIEKNTINATITYMLDDRTFKSNELIIKKHTLDLSSITSKRIKQPKWFVKKKNYEAIPQTGCIKFTIEFEENRIDYNEVIYLHTLPVITANNINPNIISKNNNLIRSERQHIVDYFRDIDIDATSKIERDGCFVQKQDRTYTVYFFAKKLPYRRCLDTNYKYFNYENLDCDNNKLADSIEFNVTTKLFNQAMLYTAYSNNGFLIKDYLKRPGRCGADFQLKLINNGICPGFNDWSYMLSTVYPDSNPLIFAHGAQQFRDLEFEIKDDGKSYILKPKASSELKRVLSTGFCFMKVNVYIRCFMTTKETATFKELTLADKQYINDEFIFGYSLDLKDLL
jgi:hypothetical protein